MELAKIGTKAGTLVKDALGSNYPKLMAAAPKIALGVGIVGVVGGCVAACVATTKLDRILDEHEENMAELETDARYDDPQHRGKEKTRVYLRTAGSLVLNYAPSVCMIGGGVGLILASHNVMSHRLSAAADAYSIMANGFQEYRKAVLEELGEEADARFRFGIDEEPVEIVETDAKGKEKKVEKVEPKVRDDISGFARVFDEGCDMWSSNPEYNLMNLRNAQNTANDMLWARGSLLLNEVYDMLGMGRTEVGKNFGWKVEHGDTPLTKFVDFGIYDWSHHPARKDFINGREPSILLDFNVDGPVKF